MAQAELSDEDIQFIKELREARESGGINRRQALGLLAGVGIGGAAGALGVETASAAPTDNGEVAAKTGKFAQITDSNDNVALSFPGDGSVNTEDLNNAVQVLSKHEGSLQSRIDAAPTSGVVVFDPSYNFTESSGITVTTDGLTIIGANVKQASSADVILFDIQADDVEFCGFDLDGNKANNSGKTSAVRVIDANHVHVHHGICRNTTRHGVLVEGDSTNQTRDVTVETVRGTGVSKDVISLSGAAQNLFDVTARNIRAENGGNGAVEVADGVVDASVQTVFAKNCTYAVAYEDHGNAGEYNEGAVIAGVRSDGCDHTVKANTSQTGHSDLTIRDVEQENILIADGIDGLTIENVRIVEDSDSDPRSLNIADCSDVHVEGIYGAPGRLQFANLTNFEGSDLNVQGFAESGEAIFIYNCDDGRLNGATIDNFDTSDWAIRVENSINVRVEDVDLLNEQTATDGIGFELTDGTTMEGLWAHDCHCNVSGDGIKVRNNGNGSIGTYLITHNAATISDNPGDANSIVEKNVSP